MIEIGKVSEKNDHRVLSRYFQKSKEVPLKFSFRRCSDIIQWRSKRIYRNFYATERKDLCSVQIDGDFILGFLIG